MNTNETTRRRFAELSAIVGCGALNIAAETWLPKAVKVPLLSAVAAGWIVYLWRRRDWRAWGFRADNAREPAVALSAFAAAVLCAAAATARGPLPIGSLAIFAVYPVWGILQQFALQVLVTRNLRALGAPAAPTVAIAAALFGLSHYPDAPLMLLTASGGLVWTSVYLWRPNLWVIGVCHAWVGTLAYYWSLGQDPWAQLF